MNGKPTLIAFVGLPRSGKSTITSRIARVLGAPIVRRDAIRLALHGKRYESLAEPIVKGISSVMIRSLFEAGHPVVICDETNYSKQARNALRDDAKWDTVFCEITTPPKVCQDRAHKTDQDDLIPIIQAMWERFEPLDKTDLQVDERNIEAFASALSQELNASQA